MTELRYDPARLPPLRASAADGVGTTSSRHAAPTRLRRSALRIAARGPCRPSSTGGCRRSTACWRRTRCSAWTTSAPAWARGIGGAELGRTLAERARELAVGLTATSSSPTSPWRCASRPADDAAVAAFFAAVDRPTCCAC